MSKHTYYQGWRRILQRAGLPHVGTHGIRHRSATDIANSGVPVKVGMALTAHKTVTMFMRYVHTEDAPVRAAADAVTQRRLSLVGGAQPSPSPLPGTLEPGEPPTVAAAVEAGASAVSPDEGALGLKGRKGTSRTGVENYRPFRHRSGENRSLVQGTKCAKAQEKSHA
jgi:hypothetical protein